MRRASYCGVSFALLGSEFSRLLGDFGLRKSYQLVLKRLKTCLIAVAAELHDRVTSLRSQPVEYILLLHHDHLLLHLCELGFIVCLAGNDVELRARGLALRIHIVTLTRSGDSAAFMEMLGIDKLGFYRVARASATELPACRRTL